MTTQARPRGRRLSVDHAKISDMLKSDHTYQEIAQACNCSIASVQKFATLPAAERRRMVNAAKKRNAAK